MGSENSTGSGSFASVTGNGEKASLFMRFARLIERIAHKPLTRSTKKKIAMSATRRDSFIWTVTRAPEVVIDKGLQSLFVRVDAPLQNVELVNIEPESTEWTSIEVPKETSVYFEEKAENVAFSSSFVGMQGCAMTSDGAVADIPVYSGLSEDFDAEPVPSTSVVSDVTEEVCESENDLSFEVVAIEESEEEKAFFDDLYETIAAESVIDVMGIIVPEVFYHAPEYVITDIADSAECSTTIDIPAVVTEADAGPESAIADFIFGFKVPANSIRGPVTFSFTAGTVDEDIDSDDVGIRIVSHDTGSDAVSVSSCVSGAKFV